MKSLSFTQLLHAFFHEWMAEQHNLSHHTVLSYRDTWRLFLRFVSQQKGRPVARLALADLDVSFGEAAAAFDLLLDLFPAQDPPTKNLIRTRVLDYFEILGSDDPTVAAARRRLTGLLY